MASARMDFVGPYHLTRLLAQDAFGATYRCTRILGIDPNPLGAVVWLLAPELARHDSVVELLIADLRHALRVDDVNVAAPRQISRQDSDRYYVVSEWSSGVDLGRFLKWVREKRAVLDPGTCTAIGLGVSSALAACHGTAPTPLPHGAIGARQVILSATGAVKLIALGRGRARAEAGRVLTLPELISEVSVEADLRALGQLLAEVLSVSLEADASAPGAEQLESLARTLGPALRRQDQSSQDALTALWAAHDSHGLRLLHETGAELRGNRLTARDAALHLKAASGHLGLGGVAEWVRDMTEDLLARF